MNINFTIYVLMSGGGCGHDSLTGATLDSIIAEKHKETGGWVEEYTEGFILKKDNDFESGDGY